MNDEKSAITIGKVLKENRLKQDIDLTRIAQSTKINLRILKALENDQLDETPSRSYVSGFVKSYARELKIDPEKALKLLEDTYRIQEGKIPVTTEQENPSQSEEEGVQEIIEKKPIPYKIITKITLSLTILIGIGYGVFYIIDQINNIKIPDELRQATAKKTIPQIPLAPKTSQEALMSNAKTETPIKKEQQITKNENAEKKTLTKKTIITKVSNKPKAIKIKLKSIKTALYSIISNAPENQDETIIPKRIKQARVPNKENIYIKALDDNSWITYKTDDNPIKSFTLKKGRSIIIRGNTVRIFMGKVHGLRIFYNNQLVKTPSKSGVKSLIFPKEKIKDFKLPLFIYNKVTGVFTTSDKIEKSKSE